MALRTKGHLQHSFSCGADPLAVSLCRAARLLTTREGNRQDFHVHLQEAIMHSGSAGAGRYKLHWSQQMRPWFQEGLYLLFIADIPGGSSPGDGRNWVPRCLTGQCNLFLQLHGCFILHIGYFGFCWKESKTFIQLVLRRKLPCQQLCLKPVTLREKGFWIGTSLLPYGEGTRVTPETRIPACIPGRPFLPMLAAEACKRT